MDRKQAGTGPSRRHIQSSKIAKRLPSVKYSFTVVENRKFFEKFFWKNYILKKWTEWRANVSQCRKTERGTLWGFSTSILSQNIKKMQGDPLREKNFEKKIRKKCLAVPKKIERGDSLVSPGMVCYAEKQVKPFWSSSLGQMVQFDTIIFCRTFKNYFGQFVWIEKKRVTIIVAFHFMKRRLKKSHYNSRVSLHEEEELSRDLIGTKIEANFPITAGWTPNKQLRFSKSALFRILSPHSKLLYHICSQVVMQCLAWSCDFKVTCSWSQRSDCSQLLSLFFLSFLRYFLSLTIQLS